MSFLISLVDISFSYVSSELSRFSHTETSPDPYQTFNIELLRKQLTAYAVSYFRNNAPGLMFDMVLNTFLATVMQKSCYGNFRKLRRKQMQQCLFSKILQVFILSQRTFTTCFPCFRSFSHPSALRTHIASVEIILPPVHPYYSLL